MSFKGKLYIMIVFAILLTIANLSSQARAMYLCNGEVLGDINVQLCEQEELV